jgi:hypothetical protein
MKMALFTHPILASGLAAIYICRMTRANRADDVTDARPAEH